MDRFTVIELKHFLKEYGLPTAGNKIELIERLIETFKDDGQTVEAFVQSDLFDKDSLFGGVAAKQPTIISHVSGKTHASGKTHDSGRTHLSGSINPIPDSLNLCTHPIGWSKIETSSRKAL